MNSTASGSSYVEMGSTKVMAAVCVGAKLTGCSLADVPRVSTIRVTQTRDVYYFFGLQIRPEGGASRSRRFQPRGFFGVRRAVRALCYPTEERKNGRHHGAGAPGVDSTGERA